MGRIALGPWAKVDLDEANEVLDEMLDQLSTLKVTQSEVEKTEALTETLPDLPPAATNALAALDALPGSEVSAGRLAKLIDAVPIDDLKQLLPHLEARSQDGRETDLRAYTYALFTGVPDQAGKAFEAIFDAGDPNALSEALTIAEAWVTEAEMTPEDAPLWHHLPDPGRLTDIADQIEGTLPDLADRMVVLANRMEDLGQDDDG